MSARRLPSRHPGLRPTSSLIQVVKSAILVAMSLTVMGAGIFVVFYG